MRQKSGDRLPAALVLILCWVLTAGGQRLSASARFDKMPNVVVCYADWAQCDGKVLIAWHGKARRGYPTH